jgi:hypothetical protein
MENPPARLLLPFALMLSLPSWGAFSRAAAAPPAPPATNRASAGAGSAAPAAPPAATPAAASEPAAQDIPAPPDVAAPPADAEVTSSGLASKVLVPGTGSDHPLPADKVKVHYTGWTTDGKMFDSSVVHPV